MIKNYSFELLNEKYLNEILLLRNQKKVRDASINTNIIKKNEHKEWFKNEIKKNFFNHYVLKHNQQVIGSGYGDKFVHKKKSCNWGFYLDLSISSEIKYGSIIKYLLFQKLFKNKNINQIECQVKKGNEWIKNWHIRWGHELKSFDKKLNCYNLLLKKENWKKIKNKIYEDGFIRKYL